VETAQNKALQGLPDEEIVSRVLAGEAALFEIIMRRYNQRLYRVAYSILRNDAEAEDVMQEAYVRAFQHFKLFEARAKFATWLTRNAVLEANLRSQRGKRWEELDAMEQPVQEQLTGDKRPGPEQRASDSELAGILEEAVANLPELYRSVFVLREIEQMNTSETAEALDLTEENVKVRLHRGKALLREHLLDRLGSISGKAFAFHAVRCDRIVANVFARIRVKQ
jgi:RNA polymerase sigma-70 factor (ECF subfamily)